MRFNSILSKIVAGLALLAVVSIVSSLIGLKTSAQLAQNGLKVGRDLAPLGDAAMEIKLTATHAHLLFEEIMAGDQEESIDEVWSLLDETRFYARAVMEGGENDEGVFFPSQSPEVLAKMRAVLEELDIFVQMAQTRYATLSQDQGVGTGADEQFDGLYDSPTDQIAAFSKQFANDGAAQRAAGNARYLLAHGHVLVAEILGGDTGEDFGEATGSFAAAAEDVRQLPEGEQRASILKGIDELIALANQRYDTMLSTDVAGSEADQQFDAAFQSFINDADIAEELIHDEMAAGLAAVEKARTVAVRTPIVSGVMLALLIGVCCIFASKYMATRLRELAGAMQSLTGGNLQTPIPEWKSNDEIGELLDNVRAYRDALVDRHRVELENRAAQEGSDRRAADASAMAAALRNVVASSINGDFSQTLPTTYQTEDLNDLSRQVNTMLENISAVLHETNRSVSNLAEADLTVRFEGDYEGSFAELKDNFNQSLVGLSGLLSAIQDNTDIVDRSSVSILGAAGSLSERAADQAAQLEETSSTTENLMKSIRSTADIAADVREKSADAEGRAVRGRKIVDETVQAITLISDNSQRVSDIVGIIDGIAFQTNLLALNAAVEAARAGEAGRGFAVVASEVRALAQRASDAASDIRVLIDEASTNVSNGVELVKRTGGSLSDIEAAVVEMSRAVDEISDVTRAQANDAEIISSAIKKIDQKTQTDAQAAEESASLARRMAESVKNLKSLLGSFRIAEGPAMQTEADKLAS